jgi:catechol 2,3-dioxygenase-like lactoylglutathione lyase family enzyme
MNTLPSGSPQSPHANSGSATEVEVPVPAIDLSIYVMPAFATLTVSDLAASRRWYVEGLGFAVLAEVPGPSGGVTLIHLRRWRYQDLLLVPVVPGSSTDGSGSTNTLPARGIRLTYTAHGVDLDALVVQARAIGSTVGGVVDGPSATPWNTLDVLARDPDGYEVVFTSTLPVDAQDPEFAGRMEQLKQQMLTERAVHTTSHED